MPNDLRSHSRCSLDGGSGAPRLALSFFVLGDDEGTPLGVSVVLPMRTLRV
jgi:hypothetical protein